MLALDLKHQVRSFAFAQILWEAVRSSHLQQHLLQLLRKVHARRDKFRFKNAAPFTEDFEDKHGLQVNHSI